ncbi:toprim domain-containing protein [Candidatus Bathyarchaeota archaeon]|nr:MAG: toprim domain-containing protein [Candidatus Bathyarchaeota archaeon]
MNRQELDVIKELANIKIEEILDALGIEYKSKYNYVVCACPIHGGNRQDAWSWHVDRGIWTCFSKGCHEQHGSDIFGLVKAMRDCSFMDAVDFIKGFVNLSMSPDELQKLRDQRENREFIQSTKRKHEKTEVFSPECLNKLEHHGYLETRGYPRWLLDKYHIGACLQTNRYMSNRIVIPVLNRLREIVGFTGRTLDPDWHDKGIPKWKHSNGSWVSSNLFNIHSAAEHIEETGTAILCEGPLDVLRLEEAGIHNSVAILGKKFYTGQMNILIAVGATDLLEALDNDTAGRIGGSSILKTAKTIFGVKRVPIPNGRKDIGEMSVEEIRRVFDVYEEAIRN